MNDETTFPRDDNFNEDFENGKVCRYLLIRCIGTIELSISSTLCNKDSK